VRVVVARAMAGLRARLAADLRDEAGASPVEFVLVGTLLTVLTLGVLQFGLAVYVRNGVRVAAVEGAYHAALADTTLEDGAQRTRDIVTRTVGAEYAAQVAVRERSSPGQPTVEIRVDATLPLVGLLGVPRSLEVTAHAPVESFD
jgi:Flp pilus assembly protein TadG